MLRSWFMDISLVFFSHSGKFFFFRFHWNKSIDKKSKRTKYKMNLAIFFEIKTWVKNNGLLFLQNNFLKTILPSPFRFWLPRDAARVQKMAILSRRRPKGIDIEPLNHSYFEWNIGQIFNKKLGGGLKYSILYVHPYLPRDMIQFDFDFSHGLKPPKRDPWNQQQKTLKIGKITKKKKWSSAKHPFSANMLVSRRIIPKFNGLIFFNAVSLFFFHF